MPAKILLPVILPLLLSVTLPAQVTDSSKSLFSIGARFHRSFIIQHTGKLSREVTSSNPWMIEADLNWHLRKPDTWEYCHCYPRTGISFTYTDFDMPDILGTAYSSYAFIEPFIRADRKLNFSIRFGLGITYVTKIYDAETNPDNLFFSSPLSFLALLNASVNYRIAPRLTLRAAGNYNHISNGGYSEPNLGMNFPSLNFGFDYSLHDIELPPRNPSVSEKIPVTKHRYEIALGMSAKPVTSGLMEKRYPVYVVTANFSRRVANILALNGGLEWVNDRSLYRFLRVNDIRNPNGSFSDHNRIGMLLGIDWLFGRFVFYQHLGVYVYSPVKAESRVYQRYGLNFRITERFFTGINIKAHGQDADFIDARIGYSFAR